MKKSALLFLFGLAVFSLASCASNTTAGKTLEGVNQVGRTANSIRAIQSFF
jgi:CHASE3 domain sensor protein